MQVAHIDAFGRKQPLLPGMTLRHASQPPNVRCSNGCSNPCSRSAADDRAIPNVDPLRAPVPAYYFREVPGGGNWAAFLQLQALWTIGLVPAEGAGDSPANCLLPLVRRILTEETRNDRIDDPRRIPQRRRRP